MDFGLLIRQHRRKLKMDQATLARHVGVSRQWVIAIERGNPGAEVGLVLRAVDTLQIRLSFDSGSLSPPSIDIDAIVSAAKRPRK